MIIRCPILLIIGPVSVNGSPQDSDSQSETAADGSIGRLDILLDDIRFMQYSGMYKSAAPT